jgi:hypothetical protein
LPYEGSALAKEALQASFKRALNYSLVVEGFRQQTVFVDAVIRYGRADD